MDDGIPRKSWYFFCKPFATPDRLIRLGLRTAYKVTGRRCSARTDENVQFVEELALNQQNLPGTHGTVQHPAIETGIRKSSICMF